MLGLVPFEKDHRPKTTMDKLFFLIEHTPNIHGPTTTVAFGALATLVVLRYIKSSFKSSWIKGIPEVLIVVIVSTCMSWEFPEITVAWELTRWLDLQSSVTSSAGITMVSMSLDLCP